MNSSLPLQPGSLQDLPVYQPGRPIEEVAREVGLPASGIIKLASNENPLGPSPAALAAMQKAIANLNLYPDGNAYYLKQKLAEKLGLTPANLILGNGSNEIIEFVGHALMETGNSRCRGFAILFRDLSRSSRRIVLRPQICHHGPRQGLTATTCPAMLKAAITPQTRALVVANPNNPDRHPRPGRRCPHT